MNTNNLWRALIIFSFALSSLFIFNQCDEEGNLDENQLVEALGWLFGNEDLEEVEDDVVIDPEPVDPDELPDRTSLVQYFPPIGDQGSYGTCVSWALGYNLRTALEAKEKGYSTSELSDASKQFSPKYLFWAIPNNLKGSNCNGTNFEAAFDVMQSAGVATHQTVPYQGLGDCSASPQSSWNSEAANYKINNYREIPELAQTSGVNTGTKINLLKKYLSQKRPVAFGARVGDNFMQWNSGTVLSSDTYDYSGQHAYHALALVGYDNSKGLNGAFEVVNSWNTTWGNQGRIWIDYNFFVDEFCFAAFVAALNPNVGGDPGGSSSSGKDLLSWNLFDEVEPGGGSELSRIAHYDVYNIGTETILAGEDWNICYVLYNAYNANDYQILLYDYYTDDFGSYGEDGALTEDMGTTYGIAGNWWNHINVPAGASVAETLYGQDSVMFSFSYTMPDVSGDFFLVLFADGFDDIAESDESNNYFYFTGPNNEPLHIQNGVIQMPAKSLRDTNPTHKPKQGDKSPKGTAISQKNLNTYSPEEIKALIKSQIKSGKWQEKINQYRKQNNVKKMAKK